MRASCAAVMALVMLIGWSSAVTAQMNSEAIPAAFVTGTVGEGGTALEDEGRVVYEQIVDWSDPRLPPTLRVNATWWMYGDVIAALERLDAGVAEEDAFEGDVVMVVEMNVVLDGSEGSWRGTGRAIEQGVGSDPDGRYSYYVLSGHGAYDGLHALLRGTPGHDANGPWDEQYEGWIVESPLPLVPTAPEPAER